jgi:nitrate reductase delta subunit
MRALKALAALLSYPDAALLEALGEVRAAVAAERRIARRERDRVEGLIDALAAEELMASQAAYVALFDHGRSTALNLFEHVHGDSRDRGQAMVDLSALYERGGLSLATRELPDYVPAMLEYLSTRPFDEVEAMLRECAHLLRAIGEALEARGSPYAAIFAALLSVAGEARLDARAPRVEEGPTLDDEWMEKPVTFGFGCGDARAGGVVAQPIRFVKKLA